MRMANLSDIEYLIISVMGPHAGESEVEIFDRKIQDIKTSGITFWLMKSHKAKPNMVQELYFRAKGEGKNSYCLFIGASSTGGAVPTKSAMTACSFSKNKIEWHPLIDVLSPVTGKIDNHTYALTFDELEIINGITDLWHYADFFDMSSPLKIIQGASTVCAVRKNMTHHKEKIKSHLRDVMAIGRLCDPGCVYLK